MSTTVATLEMTFADIECNPATPVAPTVTQAESAGGAWCHRRSPPAEEPTVSAIG